MGNEQIYVFNVTSSWQRLRAGYARYINNSNFNIYVQRSSGGAPAEDALDVIIRPGTTFDTAPGDDEITYVRTLSGIAELARIDGLTNGGGMAAIVDPDSGYSAAINSKGQIHTVMRAMTDTLNSSSDLLLAGGTFTGEAVDILDYAEIAVAVYADVDSADDGLTIEFSPNGETWYADGQSMSIYGTHGKTFSFQPERKYYRIVYENGDTNQSIFSLETTLRKTRAKPSSHNINKPIALDDDAELTKTVLTASLDNTDMFVNIGAHLSADGDYHLSSALIQNVYVDPNNSSATNLTSANSYTFTGVATTTIGASGIQWLLKTDKNAIVYVDQSTDGTNWDKTDSFLYFYSKGGDAITVKSMGQFFRIRVVLTGTIDTTYFRLLSKLVPISEPLPESLDVYGRLKTTSGIIDVETQSAAQVEPLGSLKTITPVRLVGTPFNNGTKDPNFWVETVAGSGSVVQDGQITLSTGTTLLSSARYETINKARKVTGTTNQFRMVGRLTTAPIANNVRRAGAYNDSNGFFFQVNGTTFGVGSRKNGVDTIVNTGSFNGNYGTDLTIGTSLGRFVIDYTSVAARFFIDGVLLHTITSPLVSIVNSLDFPVRMENYNLGANTTDSSFQLRFATIVRLGDLITNPIYRAISTNATFALKYGSGVLQRVINTDNAGVITIYDNTSATGKQIAVIDAAKTLGTLEFNAPFSDGLTIVSSGNAKFTVIYE